MSYDKHYLAMHLVMAPRRPKPRVKHSSVSVRDADVHSDVGLVSFYHHGLNC